MAWSVTCGAGDEHTATLLAELFLSPVGSGMLHLRLHLAVAKRVRAVGSGSGGDNRLPIDRGQL